MQVVFPRVLAGCCAFVLLGSVLGPQPPTRMFEGTVGVEEKQAIPKQEQVLLLSVQVWRAERTIVFEELIADPVATSITTNVSIDAGGRPHVIRTNTAIFRSRRNVACAASNVRFTPDVRWTLECTEGDIVSTTHHTLDARGYKVRGLRVVRGSSEDWTQSYKEIGHEAYGTRRLNFYDEAVLNLVPAKPVSRKSKMKAAKKKTKERTEKWSWDR